MARVKRMERVVALTKQLVDHCLLYTSDAADD